MIKASQVCLQPSQPSFLHYTPLSGTLLPAPPTLPRFKGLCVLSVPSVQAKHRPRKKPMMHHLCLGMIFRSLNPQIEIPGSWILNPDP